MRLRLWHLPPGCLNQLPWADTGTGSKDGPEAGHSSVVRVGGSLLVMVSYLGDSLRGQDEGVGIQEGWPRVSGAEPIWAYRCLWSRGPGLVGAAG